MSPKSTKLITTPNTKQPSPTAIVIGALITIIINTALLIWVVRLSAKHCGCVGGWRQDFIKYFAGITIFVGILRLVNSQGDFNMTYSKIPSAILGILGLLGLAYLVASLINIYSVITYVDDINETRCECAIKGMTTLNQAMVILRWIYIIGLCVFSAMLLYSLAVWAGHPNK